MAEFGFIIAATLGAAAGTTDLTDGVFRHLVITGRSRLALYLARIPAGLAILLPLVAVAFTMVCLVTSYAGVPQPTVGQCQRRSPSRSTSTRPSSRAGSCSIHGSTTQAFVAESAAGPARPSRSGVRQPAPVIDRNITTIYGDYAAARRTSSTRRSTRWSRSGSGSSSRSASDSSSGSVSARLLGQRTVTTVLMIVLEIIVTPILRPT